MQHPIVRRLASLPILASFALAGCGDDGEASATSSQTGGAATSMGGAATAGASGGRLGATAGTDSSAGGSAAAGGASVQGRGGAVSGGETGTGGESVAGSDGGEPSSGQGGEPSSGQGGAPATGGVPSGGAAAGGNSNTGDGFSSGLPGDSTLDTLSPEELVGLCEASQEHLAASASLEQAAEGMCRYGGAFFALLFEVETDEELQQLCEESYAECILEPLEPEPCAMTSTCTASVAEYEACIDDYPVVLESFERIPACSELTLDDLPAVAAFMPDTPPGCAALWEKCPEESDFDAQ